MNLVEILGTAVKSAAAAVAFVLMLCALAVGGTLSGIIGLVGLVRD